MGSIKQSVKTKKTNGTLKRPFKASKHLRGCYPLIQWRKGHLHLRSGKAKSLRNMAKTQLAHNRSQTRQFKGS